MLYSICSMQFWINKSNLVCAENDLSTHLCFDCILLWPGRCTARAENFRQKTCEYRDKLQPALVVRNPLFPLGSNATAS